MFYLPNIWTFQCGKEKMDEGGSMEEGGEGVEGEVSYSVSDDLQIT